MTSIGSEYVKRSRVAWSAQGKRITENTSRLSTNRRTTKFLSENPAYNDKSIWELKLLNPKSHVNIEDHYNSFLKILDDFLSNYEIKTGSTAVDLCCGTGAVTELLSDYFDSKNITGIDFAEGMLEVAREKIPEINWVLAEAKEIGKAVRPESTDIVVCRGELPNHLGMAYWEGVGKEVYDTLKPNGYFVFDFLNKEWYNSKRVPMNKRPKKPLYSPDELKMSYEKLGYSVDVCLPESIAPVLVAKKPA